MCCEIGRNQRAPAKYIQGTALTVLPDLAGLHGLSIRAESTMLASGTTFSDFSPDLFVKRPSPRASCAVAPHILRHGALHGASSSQIPSRAAPVNPRCLFCAAAHRVNAGPAHSAWSVSAGPRFLRRNASHSAPQCIAWRLLVADSVPRRACKSTTPLLRRSALCRTRPRYGITGSGRHSFVLRRRFSGFLPLPA